MHRSGLPDTPQDLASFWNIDDQLFALAQGTASGTLAYTFTSPASLADALEFSDDGGTGWSCTPTPDGNGTDPAVTHPRVRPTGPSFTTRFRIRVE